MTALSTLEARIAAATGPDREIDAALQRLFLPPGFAIHFGCAGETNAFTKSIDAIVALITRALPEYLCGLRHTADWADHHHWAGKRVWEAILANPDVSDCYSPWEPDPYHDTEEYNADHCHPALALCLAFVRAMRAKEEAK